MNRRKIDIDSMELKVFDRRGNELFKWKRAPNNVKKGMKVMKEKGIDLRRMFE